MSFVTVPVRLAGVLFVLFSVLASSAALLAESFVPDGWDPALAGDRVMERLVKVTSEQTKGAHDSGLEIVGNHAYVTAMVNDVTHGESPGIPHIYVTMSIVNLETLEVEAIMEVAKGEQVFENQTLPFGALFVPRVLQINETTLRCYFTSERPNERQSQVWYRDFDIATRTFAPTIHKAKIKVAAGTFDMQPQYFYADGVANGFDKPEKDYGLYLIDSFKEFDGQLYVGINNFPGKQSGLALVHDDFRTFEVVGHMNEPQGQRLNEPSVNRLPDGSWMAIQRNDGGNYHFTTSEDGRQWTAGREMPFVQGQASKAIFEKFGDTYYLGWQASGSIDGAYRSIFNIDVSKDGINWERKYRFESAESFQYPTLHLHDGAIWLSVTQGYHSPSLKEKIMFGRLETLGEFESQSGLTRRALERQAPSAEQRLEPIMRPGAMLFSNRNYLISEVPSILTGREFLCESIDGTSFEVTAGGDLFVVTQPENEADSQVALLQEEGFTRVDTPLFQLFPGKQNRVVTFQKYVETGEVYTFPKWVVPIIGEGVRVKKSEKSPNPQPVQTSASDSAAVFEPGSKLFSNRGYTLLEAPASLRGLEFLRASIDGFSARVESDGRVYAITPLDSIDGSDSQESTLLEMGFERTGLEPFQLFPGARNRVCVYQKQVTQGETLEFSKWVVLLITD